MAPAAAVATRESLESLLRTHKLDTTLTSARPWLDGRPVELVPTGLLPVDRALGGGLPRGQVSEIVGPASSGRTSLVRSVLAEASRRGELVALVDALDRFDPASADAGGIVLDRMLWVRGHDCGEQMALAPAWEPSRPRSRPMDRSPLHRSVDRAIKALGLILSAGGFGVVVLDIADVPPRVARQLPFTTWLRLQRMIEGTDTACVIVASQPLGRSAGGASIRLGATVAPAGRARDAQLASFHERVRASRRPFLGPAAVANTGASEPQAPSRALWSGTFAYARRLRGLQLHADVQCGLRSTRCELAIAR